MVFIGWILVTVFGLLQFRGESGPLRRAEQEFHAKLREGVAVPL